QPTTKRFYPQNELAGAVLGYINGDGDGVYGLEAYYDDYLSGVDGRSVTAKDRDGEAIPYKYKQSFDAQDGDSLILNIDTTIQLYLESALKKSVDEFNPKERACGIIMNPKTGQVYAMATIRGCDPNRPNEVYDETYAQILAGMNEDSKEYEKEHIRYLTKQWTNKAISELYNPGSVFKVITGSSALEEKVITLEGPFNCSGSKTYSGIDIHCWTYPNAHGPQSFAQAIINSCNPAFMEIGEKLGAEGFCDYFKAYGLTEKTGIDLPNEADSIYYTADTMSDVDLAESSFGQANKITPIQMITAYSAAINGGYLVTPQIVNKIVDSNGKIVKEFDPVIKRQVISEETSKDMRDTLEYNVTTEHSGNCYIQGYKIGGKSGTSQKMDVDSTGNTHVGSYCAFAPADDPQVIILVMVDEPQGDKYYGAQVATPVCVEAMTQVLPYLGFFPEYTEEELKEIQVSVPNEQFLPVNEAKSAIEALGLNVKVIGSGESVLKQSPAGGTLVKSGTVLLYTDETPEQMYTVPPLTGLSKENAIEAVESAGLNICVKGNDSDAEKAVALADQSIEAGKQVPEGTIVSVTITAVDALHE
ncbi:MAG: PASTA domain-containing protein, partial [Ruminococcus sp.]|nr:PASTA domain-containing protein [Ruminococcus sp.]